MDSSVLGVLVLAAIFVWTEIAKSPSADVLDNNAHIFFFDVGQGDAELIQKGSYQILIDGGPDDKVLAELGEVMPAYDRKIEIVILTHPHADHLVGINQIFGRYEIGTVYYSGAKYDSNGHEEFLDNIKNKTAKIPRLQEKIEPFDNGSLTFLWPGEKFEGKTEENLNNVSGVVKFCYFLSCALFTGDIETDGQAEMFNYYSSRPSEAPAEKSEANDNIFQSDLLKIPHHGSKNGTNQALLDNVKPKYAVMEVGAENKYGHPHAPVLGLLQKNNIKNYRTDRDGTIEFIFALDKIIKR